LVSQPTIRLLLQGQVSGSIAQIGEFDFDRTDGEEEI